MLGVLWGVDDIVDLGGVDKVLVEINVTGVHLP